MLPIVATTPLRKPAPPREVRACFGPLARQGELVSTLTLASITSLLIPTTWRTGVDQADEPDAKCLVSGLSDTTQHSTDGWS